MIDPDKLIEEITAELNAHNGAFWDETSPFAQVVPLGPRISHVIRKIVDEVNALEKRLTKDLEYPEPSIFISCPTNPLKIKDPK